MNDLKNYISNYALKADEFLKVYFLEKKKEAKNVDPLAVDALSKLETFIYGGKKVRGALTVLGYQMCGGVKFSDILPISCAIEIMHSSLLIHDDFIDKDEFRRGKPTIHKIYEKGESEHYGGSMALLVGDIGIFLSNQIFAQSNFDSRLIVKALYEYQKLLINTGHGEIMDVAFDRKEKVTWDEILNVRVYKTAHYTFVMPLTVGAILGGGGKPVLRAIENYGEPVGIGFQVRDDWLGVFGNPEVTGKSNESDIKEGKRTLLYLKTLELAKEDDKNFLRDIYKSKIFEPKDVNRVRQIMENCGAKKHSEKLALDLAEKGKKFISKMTSKNEYQRILGSFAEFVVTRDK